MHSFACHFWKLKQAVRKTEILSLVIPWVCFVYSLFASHHLFYSLEEGSVLSSDFSRFFPPINILCFLSSTLIVVVHCRAAKPVGYSQPQSPWSLEIWQHPWSTLAASHLCHGRVCNGERIWERGKDKFPRGCIIAGGGFHWWDGQQTWFVCPSVKGFAVLLVPSYWSKGSGCSKFFKVCTCLCSFRTFTNWGIN